MPLLRIHAATYTEGGEMSTRFVSVLVICSSIFSCGGSVPTPSEPPDDLTGFEYAGNLVEKRLWHTATLLNDGRLLIAGGAATDSPGYVPMSMFHASTELFDPETQTSSAARSLSVARTRDMGILLQDGRVVILGAHLAPVEIYDPQSGRFSAHDATLGDISTAALLPDGSILTYCALGVAIFDPDTGNFTSISGLDGRRGGHTATMLLDGRILIVGGGNSEGLAKAAEIYDPTSNAFTEVGELHTERRGHKAVLLQDGTVLVIGGSKGVPDSTPEPVTAAEIYDPATGTFSPAGTPGITPIWAAAVLRKGDVFLIGGEDGNVVLYDPLSGAFAPTGDSIGQGRVFFSTTVLRDGRVLVVGGLKDGEASDHVLIYNP